MHPLEETICRLKVPLAIGTSGPFRRSGKRNEKLLVGNDCSAAFWKKSGDMNHVGEERPPKSKAAERDPGHAAGKR